MDWQEIQRRLLEGLYRELRGNWGRIGEIEERLGISEGYLGKLCQGRNDIKLGLFLKAIDALGLDQRAFLSRALEIQPAPEDCLRQLEEPGDQDRAFTRMARATVELETAEPLPAHRSATANAADVTGFAASPHAEQLRRLRASIKYRTHAFARAYLEHLDALRYDDGEGAAKLATQVAMRLIPALPGPRDGRLSLQCLALGIFGSARRLKGKFSVASQAFQLALGVSRRTGLQEDTANLMLRASYLLKDFAHFNRALALLNEALVIFVRLDCRWGIGRTLVNQGMMNCYIGDYRNAVLDLERAAEYLEGSASVLPRSHLARYQYLAYACEQLGDYTAAEVGLAAGMKAFAAEHPVDNAKLQWLQGTLAFRRGYFEESESLLRTAQRVLAEHENALQEGVVTLDLLRSLLAQEKNREAIDMATSMARLLMRFKNNLYAEAAIVELINAALEGKLSDRIVIEAQAKLEETRRAS